MTQNRPGAKLKCLLLVPTLDETLREHDSNTQHVS